MEKKYGNTDRPLIQPEPTIQPENTQPADEVNFTPAQIEDSAAIQPVEESNFTANESLESGNMTDIAIRHKIIMNADTVQKSDMFNGFSAEQWTFAATFDMTPEQLEKYTNKTIADVIAEQADKSE